MMEPDHPARLVLVAARLLPLWMLLLFGGGWAAAVGWRPAGAYVMLAGFLGEVATHLLIGVTEYRRIMGRPWPEVHPLQDDPDDW